MSSFGSLFDDKNLSYNRERELSANSTPQPPPEEPGGPPEAPQLLDNIQEIRDKAKELENAITSAVGAQSIPVGNEAVAVRAALNRQDPSSNGSYITFKTFADMMRRLDVGRNLTTEEVTDVYRIYQDTGDNSLSSLLLARQANMSKKDAEYATSQASYLLTLQLMQRGFQALEAQQQTANKYPPGIEAVPVLASVIASIAFQIKYTNNTIDQIRRSVEEVSGGKVDVEKIMEEAQKFDFSTSPNAEFQTATKTPEDARVIVGFAHSFLATTKKLGYEPWLLYADTVGIRDELDDDLLIGKRYLKDSMHPDLAKVMWKRAFASNNAIDHMASALSEQELDLETICSLKWLIQVPKAVLLLLESVYLAYLSLISIRLNSAIELSNGGNWWAFIWHLLHDVILFASMASKRLLCWFQRDPDMWAIIHECPPVAEMVDMALTGIEEIERWIFMRFEEALLASRAQEARVVFKSQFVLELKRVRMTLQRIQYVIKAAESMEAAVKNGENIITGSAEVFGDAHKRLKIVVNDKPKSFREFKKKKWNSKFLREEVSEGRIPDIMPFVSTDCPLDDQGPDFSLLEAKINESLTIRRIKEMYENDIEKTADRIMEIAASEGVNGADNPQGE